MMAAWRLQLVSISTDVPVVSGHLAPRIVKGAAKHLQREMIGPGGVKKRMTHTAPLYSIGGSGSWALSAGDA
jgi:hypothetical protein